MISLIGNLRNRFGAYSQPVSSASFGFTARIFRPAHGYSTGQFLPSSGLLSVPKDVVPPTYVPLA
jgi:hypothetical protein